ncbi:MAG: hypothetical protein AB1775_09800 [Bacteroidota bacterium]
MKSNELKIIYHSFDSDLSKTERKLFESMMYGSKEMKDEYRTIKQLRDLIGENNDYKFRDDFSKKVLLRLDQKIGSPDFQIFSRVFSVIFRKSAVIGLSFTLILILINIIFTNDISLYGIFGIKEHSLEHIINLF